MIKRARLFAHIGALLALLATSAMAGTVTGQVSAPNTSVLAKNYTISFNLSQAAFKSGSFLVTASTVNCYTDSAGNVVGLPNPVVAPVVTPQTGIGSLGAATYYVEIAYYLGSGGAGNESIVSPETVVNLSSTGELIISAPVLQPANAVGYRVYIGTSSGAETLQITNSGWGSATQSTALGAGASPQASNTSSCSLAFNDELIPTGTTYSVNMTNVNGRQVAGFPQQWYLPGGSSGTINVSNGYPISQNVAVFQLPIWSNPVNNVQQSINGPLNMNGYAITGTSFSNATFAEPKINTGIQNNGSGYQHKRVAGCTTTSAQYNTCTTTVTWNTAFADANYTVICTGEAPNGNAAIQGLTGKAASSVGVITENIQGATTVSYGTIDCVGVHD